MDRHDVGLMVQAITGHCWLRRHQSLISSDVDPVCRLCNEEEETPWHLIGECPALWQARTEIFFTHFLEKAESSAFKVLKMIKHTTIQDLMTESEIF